METVAVKGGAYGHFIINKSDFDEAVHELYVEDESEVLDREALKTEAVELGVEFAPNIGTKKLFELVEAAKAELA